MIFSFLSFYFWRNMNVPWLPFTKDIEDLGAIWTETMIFCFLSFYLLRNYERLKSDMIKLPSIGLGAGIVSLRIRTLWLQILALLPNHGVFNIYNFQCPPKTSKNQLGGVRIIQLPGALRPQSGARPIKSVIIKKKYSFASSTISVFCVSQTTILPHRHAFLTRPRFLCCRICVGRLRSNYPRWRYRNQHQRVSQTARWLWGLGTVSVSYAKQSPWILTFMYIYTCSNLHTSLSKSVFCPPIPCYSFMHCRIYEGCGTCDRQKGVSLARALE